MTAKNLKPGLCGSLALLLSLTVAQVSLTARTRVTMMKLDVTSSAFNDGQAIPKQYTADGKNISPPIKWNAPPEGTKSVAVICDDPDAPVGNWNHWTLWNLPATARGLPEGMSKEPRFSDGSQQGLNDFRKTGYNGPCPPQGKPHRYYFKLFALDVKLELKSGAGKRELDAAMQGHILAQAEWMGRYRR